MSEQTKKLSLKRVEIQFPEELHTKIKNHCIKTMTPIAVFIRAAAQEALPKPTAAEIREEAKQRQKEEKAREAAEKKARQKAAAERERLREIEWYAKHCARSEGTDIQTMSQWLTEYRQNPDNVPIDSFDGYFAERVQFANEFIKTCGSYKGLTAPVYGYRFNDKWIVVSGRHVPTADSRGDFAVIDIMKILNP